MHVTGHFDEFGSREALQVFEDGFDHTHAFSR
jgi:hypothetical protein